MYYYFDFIKKTDIKLNKLSFLTLSLRRSAIFGIQSFDWLQVCQLYFQLLIIHMFLNPLRQFASLSFTEDGKVVDTVTRLASLGLILQECKQDTKIVSSQPNKSHLPLVLEEISRTLQHKKLNVEPAQRDH